MIFKDFIKPKIAKMILAVILLFIPFIKNTICIDFDSGCVEKYLSLFTLFLDGLGKPDYLLISVVLLLASIIITYLISCSVIYIYKKIKNKK